MPFLIFYLGSFAVQYGDHFRSGIICGQFGDYLRSGIVCGPGIICGPVQNQDHPLPSPNRLPPNYVTHTKLWLTMFFAGFVLFIQLIADSLILIYSQLANMSKIDGLDSTKFCVHQSIM